jgi:glutathione S-transferase
MDKHLEDSSSGFLVGDRLTIADIACWGWVSSACACSRYWIPFLLIYPFANVVRDAPTENSFALQRKMMLYTADMICT